MDIAWPNGKLTNAVVRATETMPLTLRYAGKEEHIRVEAGKTYKIGPDLKITG